QFINVRLHLGSLKDLVIVPSGAEKRGTPGAYMYVVDEQNTARMRVLDSAMDAGESIAVRAGLKPGDRYVVEGLDRLREGSRVTVQSGPAASAAPPPGETVQPAQRVPEQTRGQRQPGSPGTSSGPRGK